MTNWLAHHAAVFGLTLRNQKTSDCLNNYHRLKRPSKPNELESKTSNVAFDPVAATVAPPKTSQLVARYWLRKSRPKLLRMASWNPREDPIAEESEPDGRSETQTGTSGHRLSNEALHGIRTASMSRHTKRITKIYKHIRRRGSKRVEVSQNQYHWIATGMWRGPR